MTYPKYIPFLSIALLLTLSSAQLDESWKDKVDPIVLAKAEEGSQTDFLILLKEQSSLDGMPTLKTKNKKGQYVFEQLQKTAKKAQRSLIEFLQSKNAPHRPFYIINAIYSKGNLSLIKQLAERSDVAQIQNNPQTKMEEPETSPDTEVSLRTDAEWGLTMIGADRVWGMGIRGEGVVVAGQDTGYEWEHPAIKEKYRGWNGSTADHNYNWHDAIYEISLLHNDSFPDPSLNDCGLDSPIPCDDHGHGTHTMGTMVGGDSDNIIGVAPQAKWVACRNMERGYGSPVSYIECFEWLMAPTDLNNTNPDPSKAPHVINNSWSCPEMEGCNENNWATMNMVVDHLKAAGIVVVVSAGNSGSKGCETVSAPAAMFSNSFTIGATAEADTIAHFSSRGPVGVDGSGRMKPNVSAPGVKVRSSWRGGIYRKANGTSMAGPHTAGAVALIISANPDLAGQVEAIETLLESTAVPKTNYQSCGGLSPDAVPNNISGHGRIDVFAAVEKALAMKSASETNDDGVAIIASPNPTGGPLHLELHNFKGESIFEVFDASGRVLLEYNWEV